MIDILNLKNYLFVELLPWLFPIVLKILTIFLIVLILNKILEKIIEKLVRRMVSSNNYRSEEDEVKRENTLINIFSKSLRIIIISIAFVMTLEAIGIPVGPILAAAGIAGIAIGFGGQYLIRDIITGLFIILENQYRVGDVVCSGDTCGAVENISLRMTTLRDTNGTVHHIPHGEIKTVSNLTQSFAKINLNVGVSYDADLDKVIAVINRVGEEMSTDLEWKDSILTKPAFLRVNDFADSAVIIKINGETLPAKQWAVAGELRLRLKKAFDKEGIEIPFPQRVMHQAKAKK